MWSVGFLMFKLVLEKAEEPDTKLPTSAASSKKQESSRKTSISALLIMPKPLIVWTTINCLKLWKIGSTRPPNLPLEKSVCRSGCNRTGHRTTGWFQIGKGIHQGNILSFCLFNLHAEYIMRNAGKHKLESRLSGEISITSDMQMIPSLWQKVKKN